MFKHILIPVDGSPTAAMAVEKAIGLARAFGSEVTAMYVIDPYPFAGIGTDVAYGQAQYLSAATAESATAIDNVKKAFDASGLTVNTRVMEGHAIFQSILDAATETGADLIVMGSHGRSGLEKLVLGSVTQRVVSHAHIPVLVVRD
jgi:nucleotide-binding universal stress UspA family protein